MKSRTFRKATSFIEFDGEKFRLTPGFKMNLNMAIARATEMLTTDTLLIQTVDGATPMTIGEMVSLRASIVSQHEAAMQAEYQGN